MSPVDPYMTAVYHLANNVEHGAYEREKFKSLLQDAVFAREVLQPTGCTVTANDQSVTLTTPLGDISIAFFGALADGQFCWMAVFTDIDEQGKNRDLYAVKLSWNVAWVDSTGEEMSVDRFGRGSSIVTVSDAFMRALAAKLRTAEIRLDRLRK